MILWRVSQQDLCIKCGKAGQLLKCNACLLAAHESCFGSSVTFEESDRFSCPLCFYTKASEAYQKARKIYSEAWMNLATFIGTIQVAGQHDELLTGVLPRAHNREGQSNVPDSSKRKNIHQQEAANLTHRDEESDQQKKKQKICGRGNDYPEETENASHVQNSNVGTTNIHSVLNGNSKNQVMDAEQQQQSENKEADSSSHDVESDKEYCPTKSHQSDDSDEIEATSSNDTGKQPPPPCRQTRHSKRLQEKETLVSSKPRKVISQQDEHTSSPSRKRNYASQKRYSNRVVPTGRRSKLSWTEEEEATLKEAMEKFAPKNDGPIPWVRILEYGRDVFHKRRLPPDLRVKWRNILKKAGSRR